MHIERINDVAGTSLKGRITASYHDLVDALGEPYKKFLDGSTVEWRLQVDDDWGGTHIVCLYDRDQDVTPIEEYDWFVGAHDIEGVNALFDFLEQEQALNNWNRIDTGTEQPLDWWLKPK